MKQRSYVDNLISFITNMRVERGESENTPVPADRALVDTLIEMLKSYRFADYPEDSGIARVAFMRKTNVELNPATDLSPELCQRLYACTIKHSVSKFEIGGVEFDAKWNMQLHWDPNIEIDNGGGHMFTATEAFMKVVMSGTPSVEVYVPFEAEITYMGTKYTGEQALLVMMNLIMNSRLNHPYDEQYPTGNIIINFEIEGYSMPLYLKGSEDLKEPGTEE